MIPFGDEVNTISKNMSDEEIELALQKDDPDYKQYKELYLDIPDIKIYLLFLNISNNTSNKSR